jgi:hypothetical protein
MLFISLTYLPRMINIIKILNTLREPAFRKVKRFMQESLSLNRPTPEGILTRKNR